MTQALVVAELLVIGLVLVLTRQWELNLLRGRAEPPGGRAALYLRLMRPQHWILFTTLFVGVACPAFDPKLILALPAVFFQQAFLFAVNDYFDRDADAMNPVKKKRNVVSSGELPLAQCRVALFTMFALGMAFSIPLGLRAVALSALFMAVSFAYTAPPFRLKGRIFWDLASHGFVVFSFPFLFTTVAVGLFSPRNLLMYVLFVFLSLQIQMSQEARDFRDDGKFEVNSVLAMGYRNAYGLMAALLAAGFVLSMVLVLMGWASALFLLAGSLCASALYDLLRTWKSGRYDQCFQNIWSRFNKKAVVCSGPVVLWWLLF